MKILPIAVVLSFLLMTSAVFALDITVTTNKTKVLMGESFVLSGKVAFDDGRSGTFTYRAAAVAPNKIIVCDSNSTKTAADGKFSFTCKTPTADEAKALGIPAASERAVIPLVAGVAVQDPEKNVTVKKHARTVVAINPDKYKARFDKISAEIDKYVNGSRVILSECDKLIEKAKRFNVTNIADKCQTIKDKVAGLVADARNVSTQLKQLSTNINAGDFDDTKTGLSIIKDDMKALRDDLKDVREQVKAVRWDKLKEVKQIRKQESEQIKEAKQELRETVKEKRQDLQERIKQIRNRTEAGVSK